MNGNTENHATVLVPVHGSWRMYLPLDSQPLA